MQKLVSDEICKSRNLVGSLDKDVFCRIIFGAWGRTNKHVSGVVQEYMYWHSCYPLRHEELAIEESVFYRPVPVILLLGSLAVA